MRNGILRAARVFPALLLLAAIAGPPMLQRDLAAAPKPGTTRTGGKPAKPGKPRRILEFGVIPVDAVPDVDKVIQNSTQVGVTVELKTAPPHDVTTTVESWIVDMPSGVRGKGNVRGYSKGAKHKKDKAKVKEGTKFSEKLKLPKVPAGSAGKLLVIVAVGITDFGEEVMTPPVVLLITAE